MVKLIARYMLIDTILVVAALSVAAVVASNDWLEPVVGLIVSLLAA